jgi:transcriptional regulator with XRE-family HTH domain
MPAGDHMDRSKEHFLSAASKALKDARLKAGLTQEEVAERMGTKQAVISRMESDTRGSISLHRFVDYAIVCGYIPHNLVAVQHDTFFQAWYPIFREANPDIPFTKKYVAEWNAHVARYGVNVPWKPSAPGGDEQLVAFPTTVAPYRKQGLAS